MPFKFAPKLSFAHSISPKSISLVQRLEVVPEQNLLLLSSAAINFSEILSFISTRNEGLTFEILLSIWYSNGAKIPDTCHPWNHSGVEWSSLIKCPADLPTVGCEVCTALLLVSKKPSTVDLQHFIFSKNVVSLLKFGGLLFLEMQRISSPLLGGIYIQVCYASNLYSTRKFTPTTWICFPFRWLCFIIPWCLFWSIQWLHRYARTYSWYGTLTVHFLTCDCTFSSLPMYLCLQQFFNLSTANSCLCVCIAARNVQHSQ